LEIVSFQFSNTGWIDFVQQASGRRGVHSFAADCFDINSPVKITNNLWCTPGFLKANPIIEQQSNPVHPQSNSYFAKHASWSCFGKLYRLVALVWANGWLRHHLH
jgi:hypothetical protein